MLLRHLIFTCEFLHVIKASDLIPLFCLISWSTIIVLIISSSKFRLMTNVNLL